MPNCARQAPSDGSGADAARLCRRRLALHQLPLVLHVQFAYFTEAGWPTPDVAKAKQLVKESGYDGSPIVLLDATETALHPQTLVVALSTRRANKNPIAQGGCSAFMSGPAAPDMFEPVGHLALRSNCEKAWLGWPCDEAIERLRISRAARPMRVRSTNRPSRPCPTSRSDSFVWSGATARISPDCSVRASRSTEASAAAGDRRRRRASRAERGQNDAPNQAPTTFIEYEPQRNSAAVYQWHRNCFVLHEEAPGAIDQPRY
jgi:hypothetical protein